MAEHAPIAVVIPCYNAAATIESTIASVQAQTAREFELVVVDDGSSDDSAAIVESIAQTEPRLRLLRQSNGGVSAARNTGIAATTAPLLAFLDADDTWYPEFLSTMASQLDLRPDVGVQWCRAEIRSPDARPTGVISSSPSGTPSLGELILGNPATTCSTLMVRRAVFDDVGLFDTELRACEDQHWMILAHLSDWRLRGVDDVLVAYRTSPDGLSANLENMLESWEAMIDRIGPERLGADLETARAEHLYYLARRSLRLGRGPSTTLSYLRQSFASDPAVPLKKAASAPVAVLRRVAQRSSSTELEVAA